MISIRRPSTSLGLPAHPRSAGLDDRRTRPEAPASPERLAAIVYGLAGLPMPSKRSNDALRRLPVSKLLGSPSSLPKWCRF
jgi:hypothetical protein